MIRIALLGASVASKSHQRRENVCWLACIYSYIYICIYNRVPS